MFACSQIISRVVRVPHTANLRWRDVDQRRALLTVVGTGTKSTAGRRHQTFHGKAPRRSTWSDHRWAVVTRL